MNLYLRLLWIWLHARLKPPIRVGATIEMRLRVWPNDIDVIGHMNNGRYMTIIDLALIEYFTRTGFLKVIVRKGWRPMLGGSMISFRRGLKPFRRYTLRFAVSCWGHALRNEAPLLLVQGWPGISVLSLRFGISVLDSLVAPAGKCYQAFMI